MANISISGKRSSKRMTCSMALSEVEGKQDKNCLHYLLDLDHERMLKILRTLSIDALEDSQAPTPF
jgi:hypothetical protein